MGSFEQMGPDGLDDSQRFWDQVHRRFLESEQGAQQTFRGVRLHARERFCAITLVKRFAEPAFLQQKLGLGKLSPVPDTATVATAAWLDKVNRESDLALGPDMPRSGAPPWNGQWLHWPKPDLDPQEDPSCPGELWDRIGIAKHRHGAPPIYYAVLAMDGDHMGQWLRGSKSPKMAQFAQLAQKTLDDPQPRGVAVDWIRHVSMRGPWFCRVGPAPNGAGNQVADVLVTTPASLHKSKEQAAGAGNRLVRLDPLASSRTVPGWNESLAGAHGRAAARPLWPRVRTATEPAGGYLTRKGLELYLNGKTPNSDPAAGHWVERPEDLFQYDRRVGIALDPDRLSTEKSQIYGASFLVPKPDVGLYVEVELPLSDDVPEAIRSGSVFNNTLPVGGEGRRAAVQCVPPVAWPCVNSDGGNTVLLLTTPGLFDTAQVGNDYTQRLKNWLPGALEQCCDRLVTAAVPGYVSISGWDLARGGPKRNRFAAPAGSVYFLNGPADADLPSHSLADLSDDRKIGWGCFRQGVWNDA